MGLRLACLALLLPLLGACSRPVPPGTRLDLLHPPDGALTGPQVDLLIRALAWGPGVVADLGDPIGGSHPVSSVPLHPLAITVRVDGRIVRQLDGGNFYRLRLRLTPGRHRIRVAGGLRHAEATLEVRDPPPLTFTPAPPVTRTIPEPVWQAVQRRIDPARESPRLLRDGNAVLVAVRRERRWRIWRLSLAAPPPRLPGAALLTVELRPEDAFPDPDRSMAMAACGNGFVLAGYPAGAERLRIWRIPRTGPVRRQADIPLGQLISGLFRRAGGFDAPAFLDRVQCFGDRLVFSMDEGVHLRVAPDGRWRITTDPGPILPLADGRWLQLDPASGVLRDEAGGPPVALPLPPRPRSWRATGPFPYYVFDTRPGWSIRPGLPPRIRVSSAHPADDALFALATSGP